MGLGPAARGPQGLLASFTAQGEVGGIWTIDAAPLEIVLRDGWLVPRSPVEVLPKDARIASLGWRRLAATRPGPGRGPEPPRTASRRALVLEGANLLLGGRRLSPGRAVPLCDGDVLCVDHRDVGEPSGAVIGGLLVTLAECSEQPLRRLIEAREDAVEVPRPGAGRAWLHGGVAAIAAGSLPLATLALSQPSGSPGRANLVLGAIACGIAGAIGISLSRVLAHSGARLDWERAAVHVTRAGFGAGSTRYAAEALDGITVRLDRDAAGRWRLGSTLRAHGDSTPLEAGRHLTLRPDADLPALAALEARRRDWLEVGRRVARALGRSPDAFVVAHTDPAWPPEKARGAGLEGRISIP